MAREEYTAIVAEGQRIEWTALRATKGGVGVDRQDALEWERPEGDGEPDPSVWLKPLKQRADLSGASLALTIPAERTLLRVMNFPTADPEELRGMVDLQAGKISPFPVDQLAISYEVLAQTEEQSHVLLAAVPRDVVEKLGAPYLQARLAPRRVDVDTLGCLRLIQEREDLLETGRDFILLVREHSTDLIVLQDRVPILFRSLSAPDSLSEEHFEDELLEELNYTLTALEAEWGPSGIARLLIYGGGDVCRRVGQRFHEQSGMAVDERNIAAALPISEGLAYRARDPRALNLAPAPWAAKLSARRMVRRIMAASLAVATLWLAAVVGEGALLKVYQNRFDRLKKRVAELEAPAEQIKLIRERVRSLEEYAGRTHTSLECLREVSALMPEGLDLLSFNYRKNQQVSLRGLSSSVSKESIIDFIQKLEQSEFFASVKEQSVTTRNVKGQRQSEFRITVNLLEESETP